MKLLLLSAALLTTPALLTALAAPVAQPPYTKKVAVFFNQATTFTQLATIKQEVLKDGIDLEYDRLEFDGAGHLRTISFHVNCEGTTWGSATEDHVPADFSFGFLRDFTPGAKVQFKIGNL